MPTLSGILLDARSNNTRDDITGALICRHDIYLQLLEGPKARVEAAFARISRDERHVGVKSLGTTQVTERIFGDWAMLHDPAKTRIWTAAEISDGALDRATPEDFRALFKAYAEAVKNDPLD